MTQPRTKEKRANATKALTDAIIGNLLNGDTPAAGISTLLKKDPKNQKNLVNAIAKKSIVKAIEYLNLINSVENNTKAHTELATIFKTAIEEAKNSCNTKIINACKQGDYAAAMIIMRQCKPDAEFKQACEKNIMSFIKGSLSPTQATIKTITDALQFFNSADCNAEQKEELNHLIQIASAKLIADNRVLTAKLTTLNNMPQALKEQLNNFSAFLIKTEEMQYSMAKAKLDTMELTPEIYNVALDIITTKHISYAINQQRFVLAKKIADGAYPDGSDERKQKRKDIATAQKNFISKTLQTLLPPEANDDDDDASQYVFANADPEKNTYIEKLTAAFEDGQMLILSKEEREMLATIEVQTNTIFLLKSERYEEIETMITSGSFDQAIQEAKKHKAEDPHYFWRIENTIRDIEKNILDKAEKFLGQQQFEQCSELLDTVTSGMHDFRLERLRSTLKEKAKLAEYWKGQYNELQQTIRKGRAGLFTASANTTDGDWEMVVPPTP